MKNMFLHIGCGKTGSSALQVWLANSAKELKRNGYFYPLFGMGKLGEHAITPGNGVPLRNSIVNKSLPVFIENIFSSSTNNVIFSSETFQELKEDDVQYLNKVCKDKSISIYIIAYVRDVYDITYSSYLQLIKRHVYTASFSSFALTRSSIQQFAVVSMFEKYFEEMQVIHYDSEKKNGVNQSFCKAIGLDSDSLPKMEKSIVNRSLTIKESQLMIMAKKAYSNQFKEDGKKFSGFISNYLISATPERKTEILFLPEIEAHFESLFRSQVDYINEKYLQTNQLKIFDPTGKNTVNSVEPLDPDLQILLFSVLDYFTKRK